MMKSQTTNGNVPRIKGAYPKAAWKPTRTHHIAVQVNGAGSIFALHFTDQRVVDYRTMAAASKKRTRDLFLGLVNHGVLMAPRAMGALSTPMGEEDIHEFIEAVDAVVAEQRPRWEAESA